MMSLTDFQIGKKRNYHKNVASYQLTSKYRDRKIEQEQKIYETNMTKLISESSER